MNRFLALALGSVAALSVAASHADLRTTYVQGPTIFPGAGASSTRGVAVNSRVGSPYFGWVYLCDAGQTPASGTLTAVQRRVIIYKPSPENAGPGASTYTEVGQINVPDTIATGALDALAPYAVDIDESDNIWIADSGDNEVHTAPPAPPAGQTTLTSVKQFSVVGSASPTPFIRGLTVTGPTNAVNVYLTTGNNPSLLQRWSGGTTDPAVTGGTYTLAYSVTLGTGAGFAQGPYGAAVDPAGNAYVARDASSSTTTPKSPFLKIDPTGTTVTPFGALPAGFPATSILAQATYVPDATQAGGGYIMYNSRVTSPAGVVGLRFDMSGNYLDGFGSAIATQPSNYSVITLTPQTSQPVYSDTDNLGNVYTRFMTGGNTALVKIFRRAPFVTDAAAPTSTAKSATASVKSSPTAVDNVTYFGADDGKVYAYDTTTGNPVSGFPVNLAAHASVATAVSVRSRAAVYFGTAGKSIYVTTNLGHVARILPDGTVAWAVQPAGPGANNVSTPAVTSTGEVLVGITDTITSRVYRLSEADGSTTGQSAPLGNFASSITSVALDGVGASNIYVGLTGGQVGDVVLLKNDALLTVASAASIATGEGVTAPPYVLQTVSGLGGVSTAYFGTLAGNFYKVNSVNMNVDLSFGATDLTPGRAVIGEGLPNSPFLDNPTVGPQPQVFYIGSNAGKVWGINALDGTKTAFYNTGDAAAIVSGTVIDRTANRLSFGTDTGKFYQLPLLSPNSGSVYGGYGPFTTTPTLDRATGRVFAGSDDQNVYAFPAAPAAPAPAS